MIIHQVFKSMGLSKMGNQHQRGGAGGENSDDDEDEDDDERKRKGSDVVVKEKERGGLVGVVKEGLTGVVEAVAKLAVEDGDEGGSSAFDNDQTTKTVLSVDESNRINNNDNEDNDEEDGGLVDLSSEAKYALAHLVAFDVARIAWERTTRTNASSQTGRALEEKGYGEGGEEEEVGDGVIAGVFNSATGRGPPQQEYPHQKQQQQEEEEERREGKQFRRAVLSSVVRQDSQVTTDVYQRCQLYMRTGFDVRHHCLFGPAIERRFLDFCNNGTLCCSAFVQYPHLIFL